VIDTSTNTLTAVIPGFGGGVPTGVAISPNGASLYATYNLGGFLMVIDTATNTVRSTGPAGPFPSAIALNPAGTRAYITNLNLAFDSLFPPITQVTVIDIT
jgi:YVTN family beta-propeller protein